MNINRLPSLEKVAPLFRAPSGKAPVAGASSFQSNTQFLTAWASVGSSPRLAALADGSSFLANADTLRKAATVQFSVKEPILAREYQLPTAEKAFTAFTKAEFIPTGSLFPTAAEPAASPFAHAFNGKAMLDIALKTRDNLKAAVSFQEVLSTVETPLVDFSKVRAAAQSTPEGRQAVANFNSLAASLDEPVMTAFVNTRKAAATTPEGRQALADLVGSLDVTAVREPLRRTAVTVGELVASAADSPRQAGPEPRQTDAPWWAAAGQRLQGAESLRIAAEAVRQTATASPSAADAIRQAVAQAASPASLATTAEAVRQAVAQAPAPTTSAVAQAPAPHGASIASFAAESARLAVAASPPAVESVRPALAQPGAPVASAVAAARVAVPAPATFAAPAPRPAAAPAEFLVAPASRPAEAPTPFASLVPAADEWLLAPTAPQARADNAVAEVSPRPEPRPETFAALEATVAAPDLRAETPQGSDVRAEAPQPVTEVRADGPQATQTEARADAPQPTQPIAEARAEAPQATQPLTEGRAEAPQATQPPTTEARTDAPQVTRTVTEASADAPQATQPPADVRVQSAALSPETRATVAPAQPFPAATDRGPETATFTAQPPASPPAETLSVQAPSARLESPVLARLETDVAPRPSTPLHPSPEETAAPTPAAKPAIPSPQASAETATPTGETQATEEAVHLGAARLAQLHVATFAEVTVRHEDHHEVGEVRQDSEEGPTSSKRQTRQESAAQQASRQKEGRSPHEQQQAPRAQQNRQQQEAGRASSGRAPLPLAKAHEEENEVKDQATSCCPGCGTDLPANQASCPVCSSQSADTLAINLAEIRTNGQRHLVIADLVDASEASHEALAQAPRAAQLLYTPRIPSAREVVKVSFSAHR